MKLFMATLIVGLSISTAVLSLNQINLIPGQSVRIGSTEVSCNNSGPTYPSSGNMTLSEELAINGQWFKTGLNGQTGYVTNTQTGERFNFGCCLIKNPKIFMIQNIPMFIGVGTDLNLYFYRGLNQSSWKPAYGRLIDGDGVMGLALRDSYILFGIGSDLGFYMTEFSNNGDLLKNGWTHLPGSGPRIIGVYKKDDNDFRLIVEGSDGNEWVRTRYTDFVRL